jgi:hypothetical protein
MGDETGEGDVAEEEDVSSIGDITAAMSAGCSFRFSTSNVFVGYAKAGVSLPSKPLFAQGMTRLAQDQL